MNIAFVANFHKTYFFERIARNLRARVSEIYWICFDENTYRKLSKEWSESNVLLLSRRGGFIGGTPLGDFKLNELVSGDRFLRHQAEWSYDYLKGIQVPVRDFIVEKEIRMIFGEITHAHEILIYRITRQIESLNCEYLHPQSIRIPSKRFFFLSDEFQSQTYSGISVPNDQWESEFHLIEAERPRRVAQVDQAVKKELSLSGRFRRLRYFFTNENISGDSPSEIPNKWKRSIIALNQEWNKWTYRLVKTAPIEFLKGKNYVLYTLHMQPEASVDVVGAYYDNQLQNIRNIWRILPHDWYVVVKEHTNAIGNRPYGFFKAIKSLRNAVIIDERADSHELIEEAQAIFTVSGTVAYEAALKQKPAFTFADIFFNRLRHCHKVSLEHFRNLPNIQALLDWAVDSDRDKMDKEAFSRYIFQQSFPGIIDPPLESEDWEDEKNIKILADSFSRFLKQIE